MSDRFPILRLTRHAIERAADHGIGIDQMYQVSANRSVLVRNRKDRGASHLLIGRDDQGRCLAMPVNSTEDPGTWRVISVWPCKTGEAAKLR